MAIILDSNNYYTLEYSLIPENKIRQISGSIKNNDYTQEKYYESTNVSTVYNRTAINGVNNVEVNLAEIDFIDDPTKIEQTFRYKQINASGTYYNETYKENLRYEISGRIETVIARAHIRIVSDNEPLKIKDIITSYNGKNIKAPWTSDSYYTFINNILPYGENENICLGKENVVNYFSTNYTENSLDSNIDIYFEGTSIGVNYYSDSYNKFCDDFINLDKLIVNDDQIGDYKYEYSKGTGNVGGLNSWYEFVDDYTYDIYVAFPYRYNAVVGQRYVLPSSGGTYSEPTGSISLNIVQSLNIRVVALIPNGSSITFEHSLGTSDDYKYKTSFNNTNELVNQYVRVGVKSWDKAFSDILIEKFQNGKLWINAQVSNKFMLQHNIHIDSQMYIKDIDNEFITRKNVSVLFAVKNIELVYKESQYYYNVVLMEV